MEIKHVSFDIADASFTFYTEEEWQALVTKAYAELQEDDMDIDGMEVAEAIEAVYGDEFFYDRIV